MQQLDVYLTTHIHFLSCCRLIRFMPATQITAFYYYFAQVKRFPLCKILSEHYPRKSQSSIRVVLHFNLFAHLILW